MICPHCKKAIPRGIDERAQRRIRELRQQGYSVRDIEKLLLSEGMLVSFGSVARVIRKGKGV